VLHKKMMDLSDDHNIIVQLQQDDPAAFESLFHLYHKRVYHFALGLLPSAQDAEEIVQNVFMAVWNQRRTMQISTSLLSYLYGIARHMVYTMIHEKMRQESFVNYFLSQKKEYSHITEDTVFYNDLLVRIQKLLSDLPERRREIFLLSRNEGLSYAEIAEKLGISENTVDTQIRHALNYLRNKIIEK